MEEQTGLVFETEPSDPPAERRRLTPRTDSSTTMLALMEQLALDPGADVAKLERVIALYERLTGKEAELAYNAAKGRILKKLAGIKIVKNRAVLSQIDSGKPQKGTREAFKYAARGDRQTPAPASGGGGDGSLLFRHFCSSVN